MRKTDFSNYIASKPL